MCEYLDQISYAIYNNKEEYPKTPEENIDRYTYYYYFCIKRNKHAKPYYKKKIK